MLGVFLVRCTDDLESNILVATTFLIGLLTTKLFYQKTKAKNVLLKIGGLNFQENIELQNIEKPKINEPNIEKWVNY